MVIAISKFERLFRTAASLDVDKNDLKRLSDFINVQIRDLCSIGQAHAKANGRDIIEPWDLPITKGLEESIQAFQALDVELELSPILEQMAALPPLDLALSEATQARLPSLVGAIIVALAKTFKVLDPAIKNPDTGHWERAFTIFDLLL